MKTLVTGASGFLGSAVLRQLIKRGHEIRALVRANSDRRNFKDVDVELFEGDLEDADSLKRAVNQCDQLYHVAADYRLWIPDPGKMYKINVEGSKDLIRFAADAGVSKIIYTSSVAALGLTTDGTPADEQTPNSRRRCLSWPFSHLHRAPRPWIFLKRRVTFLPVSALLRIISIK